MSDCTFQLKVLLCVLKILKVVIRRYFDPTVTSHGSLTSDFQFSIKLCSRRNLLMSIQLEKFVFSQVCVCTLATIGANLGFILVQM